jgi:hypothetical protein
MGPAHLRTTHRPVSKVMNQLAEKIRLRHKVRVEDGNQSPLADFIPFSNAPALNQAIIAMDK